MESIWWPIIMIYFSIYELYIIGKYLLRSKNKLFIFTIEYLPIVPYYFGLIITNFV